MYQTAHHNLRLFLLQRTVWKKASTSSGPNQTSPCSSMSPKAKRKLLALEHLIWIGANFLGLCCLCLPFSVWMMPENSKYLTDIIFLNHFEQSWYKVDDLGVQKHCMLEVMSHPFIVKVNRFLCYFRFSIFKRKIILLTLLVHAGLRQPMWRK